eukprot:6212351-Pleurochrysis_carterae.AAC.2
MISSVLKAARLSRKAHFEAAGLISATVQRSWSRELKSCSSRSLLHAAKCSAARSSMDSSSGWVLGRKMRSPLASAASCARDVSMVNPPPCRCPSGASSMSTAATLKAALASRCSCAASCIATTPPYDQPQSTIVRAPAPSSALSSAAHSLAACSMELRRNSAPPESELSSTAYTGWAFGSRLTIGR